MKITEKKHDIWVDNVKVIACVLVVLGHFFQSMVKSNILLESDLYCWFEETIYCFHVPLFFICSGYLYQKLSLVDSIKSWGMNLIKKALNLGIPYFFFSFVTWALKTVFSGEVNSQIGSLFDTLFIRPTAPYWYLYTLFFLFLITPTFKNIRMAVVSLVIAFVAKVLIIFIGSTGVYALTSVLINEVWFVLGMCFCIIKRKTLKNRINLVLFFVFICLSITIYKYNLETEWSAFILGLLASVSLISFISNIDWDTKQNQVFKFLTKYTMPIFLMHTLFAAAFRSALFKLEITSSVIHIVFGIAISFIGPIIAAECMKKLKFLECFLYPGKYIKPFKKGDKYENFNDK